MTFTPEQIKSLSGPLDPKNVKARTQGGSQVSYIEAYHAENEANRIFGFDAWDRETSLTHIGEREHDGKWRVYYRAQVRITVRSADGGVTVREGNGFGSGIDKDIGQAHESALKEAESDAEKRALKTFGNPFGQALYDKAQTDVRAPEKDAPPADALLTEEQRIWLAGKIEASTCTVQTVCEQFNVSTIPELTFGKAQEVVSWLKTQKKAA